MRKRIESLVLTLCMVLTLIPAAALPARAEDGQTVTTFDALKSAFDGASTNADSPTEITLGANIDTTEGLTVKSGTYVVLDLAGHTIKRTSGNGYVIGVSGNLTLNDSSGTNTGKITGGNRSDGYGGGVYVYNNGTFKMTGGTITGNSAQYGGGVAVYDGTFEMTGGSITGNNATTDGGGVHASGTGTFKLSGNPVISGNYKNGTTDADGVYTSGTSNNVYATSTNLLQVTGELTDGADIHMSTGLGNVFTNSTDVSLNDASKFHSDNGGTYEVTQDVDGQLMVVQFTSVSTWDDLRTNLNNGGKYKLTADVTYASGEGLSVPSGKTVILDLASHKIDINQQNKIGIKVEGKLALNDSSVGKTGQITGSKRTNETEGCGVLVEGTFTMNGGKITGNSTTQTSGAGVYVKTGTFNMNGGEISNNTAAKSGGGVFVGPTATFNMNGGTITNNKAGDPSSCYGGGVFVQGTFTISGSASVTGNTLSNNDKSNVHLHSVTGSNKYITVTGPLTGDGEIGVTVNNPPTSPSSPVTLTNTADGKLAYNVAGKFVSDRTDYTIYKDANDNQLKLAAPMTWNSVKTALNNGQDVKLTNDIKDTGSAGALQVPSNKTVTLDLNGYTIDRNRSSAEANGYVIKVEGSLTLKDTSEAKNGTITGGSNTGDGGGVYVNGGTLVMEGGTISDNAAKSGGGVCMAGGTFTMSGGTITKNSTTGTDTQTGNGGGVNAFSGTFTMSGGTISNNTANRYGGGVEAKIFTMSGGTISGNTVTNGNGGGVFIDTGGTLKLSGTPTISGNKKSGADNNVGLLAGTTITVTDTLSNSTPIGVTTQNAPSDSPIKVTNNLGTYANTSQFASDNTDYNLYAPSTGSSTYVVYLYTKKTITWKSQDGGTVLETDSNLKAGTKPHYDGAEPTKAPDEQYTYTFAGWATSANQESGRSDSFYDGVTQDTIYYAAFSKTPQSYTLTWAGLDGATVAGGTAAGSVPYGTTLTAPTAEKAGYTFNGWSPAVAATMPAENATYTAQWTPTNYTITYDLAGGTNGASPVTSYTIESEGTLPTPTKSAHTFNGWKVTTAGGNWTADTVLAAGASLTGRYGDVTLTAQWINNGTVTAPTFNPAGGSYTGTQSVTISCATDGATIYYTTDGTTPTASSTQYTGAISISADTTIKAYAAKDGMTDSAVATAAYTITAAPATYTVSFDANGGSGSIADGTKTHGEALTLSDGSGFTKSGFHITGWNTTTDGTGTAYSLSASYTDNAALTLYAQWTATSYTITYALDGGTGDASKTYTIESTGTLPTPTKSAHTFNGWKVTTAGGNWTADTVLAAGASLTGRYGDVTLTAQWINNGTVTTPTLSPAGGSYIGTQSVTISCATDGATIYYTMNGDAPTTSSTQYTGAISISTDTTIKAYAVKDGMTDSTVATATYTISSAPATYTVSFDANGGSTVTAQTVESGNTATRPADPTRGGYTFGGWFTDESYATAYDFSTPVTAGLTLYAKWTANPTPTPSPTPAPSYDDTDYEEPEPTYTVTAPVSGDENTVDVTVSVTGTAATLRTADIESALSGNDETGDVVIDVSNLKQDVTSITIPAKTVAAIAAAVADEENSTDSLTVKLTDGTVTFDAAAVDAITEQAEGKDLRLNLDGVETSAMSDTQQAATANLEVEGVLDVYMTSGNTRISDFKGGSAEIRLPFTAPDGRTAAEYRVWYVAEDGALTDQRARYDTSNNCFVFTVTHFSNYVVAYSGCPQDETCPISAFTDADPTAWYHDGVHYVLENGIMSGYGGAETGSFGPNDKTSRAMIAQILWNMEGKPVVNYLLTYSDVAEGMWYTEAVRWVTAEGIMNGYGDGLFGPDDAMTREQLVTIVHRYAIYKGVDVSVGEDTNILSYDDAFDVSEWAIPAMQWAVGSGAVGGRTDRTLNPKDTATRAEIATIMMRYSIEISK